MSPNALKKQIRKVFELFGYELKLHRISPTPHQGKNIAFLHIAKCGGVSIDSALRSAFASSGQHKLNRKSAINTTLCRFSQSEESPENSARFADEHIKTLNTLMGYYLGLNWSYVSGHANITSPQLEVHQANYHFVTVLRDPIKRFTSHYIFTKLTNELPIMLPNKFSTDNLVNEAKAIIESRRGWHMMNTPTMCLTGQYPTDQANAKAMQSLVSANLSKFSVVGFLHQLHSFTKQIEQLTNKEITIAHRNASNVFASETELKVRNTLEEFFSDESTKAQLIKLGQSEIANYENALERYAK